MAKTLGYGSALIATTSTGLEVVVGKLRNISGPGVSGTDVDTTCMDGATNYRTFIGGLLDPGEVTAGLVYDPADTTQTRLARWMGNRYVATWIVTHGSTTTTETFTGYVKGLSREIPLDDVITADVTIKVTADPGYTT